MTYEHASNAPDPTEIARRIAAATGNPNFDPNRELSGGQVPYFDFGVSFDTSDPGALLLAGSMLNTEGDYSGFAVDGNRALGHYDFAQQRWLFYRETIHEGEQAALSAVMTERAAFRQVMLEAGAVTDPTRPYIEFTHPMNVRAATEMSALLERAGLLGRLVLDESPIFGGMEMRRDEATTAMLTLTPRLVGPGIGNRIAEPLNDNQTMRVPEQALTLVYRSLISTRGGQSLRVDRNVELATVSADDPDRWEPTDLLSPEEWAVLAAAPDMLRGYRQEEPAFSPEDGVVVRYYGQQPSDA